MNGWAKTKMISQIKPELFLRPAANADYDVVWFQVLDSGQQLSIFRQRAVTRSHRKIEIGAGKLICAQPTRGLVTRILVRDDPKNAISFFGKQPRTQMLKIF